MWMNTNIALRVKLDFFTRLRLKTRARKLLTFLFWVLAILLQFRLSKKVFHEIFPPSIHALRVKMTMESFHRCIVKESFVNGACCGLCLLDVTSPFNEAFLYLSRAVYLWNENTKTTTSADMGSRELVRRRGKRAVCIVMDVIMLNRSRK